jgi:glycosyltransferase involved in cell wall biosynthesis
MISIVTGTLDRKHLLEKLIQNTVESCEKLELVLVDGGSTDGTQEFIKNLNHSRIKLIEVGKRSTYPHYMNLGIRNSKYEWVCQWNDDAILVNSWDEVIEELNSSHDFYLFNWKYGSYENIFDKNWVDGSDLKEDSRGGWWIWDRYDIREEIVMNYGIYNKKIFREIGMYSNEYQYYYADGDMSRRAYLFGYKHKSLYDIKVCSIYTEKKAYIVEQGAEFNIYSKNHEEYKNKILNKQIEFL